MALDDVFGTTSDAQDVVDDLYGRADKVAANVDPQFILNKLHLKAGLPPPQAPRPPQLSPPQTIPSPPSPRAREGAPETSPAQPFGGSEPVSPDETASPTQPLNPPAPEAKAGQPAFQGAEPGIAAGPEAMGGTGDEPALSKEELKKRGFTDLQIADIEKQRASGTGVPQQPFRSGGPALDILGGRTGMNTGQQAWEASVAKIKDAEAARDEAAKRRDAAQANYDAIIAKNMPLAEGDPVRENMVKRHAEQQARLRTSISDYEKAAEALTNAKRDGAPTQGWIRDKAERIPGMAASQAIDTAAAAARIATAPFPAAQEKISELRDYYESKFTQQWFHSDPTRDKDFGTKLVNGVVSSAMFAAIGYAGKALGVGATLTTGVAGALPSGEQGWKTAEQYEKLNSGYAKEWMRNAGWKDVSSETANGTVKWGMFITGLLGGATEAVPMGHMFERLEKISGGGVTRMVGMALAQGGEEAAQEAVQQLIQNGSELGLMDPNKSLTEGVAENALIGALTGTGMTMVLGSGSMALNSLTGGSTSPVPAPASAPGAPTPVPASATPGPTSGALPAASGGPGAPPAPAGGPAGWPGGTEAWVVLKNAGYDEDEISTMTPQDAVAAVQEAIQSGVPVEPQPEEGAPDAYGTLRAYGYSDKEISGMTPEGRNAALQEAIQSGVIGSTVAPEAPEVPEEVRKQGEAIMDAFASGEGKPIDITGIIPAEAVPELEKKGIVTGGTMTPEQIQQWFKHEEGKLSGPKTPVPATKPAEQAAAAPAKPAEPQKVGPKHTHYDAAVALIHDERNGSPSFLQRNLGLSHRSIVDLTNQLMANGVLGPAVKGRHPVLLDRGVRKVNIRGMGGITIEADKGKHRHGTTPEGKAWKQKVGADLGYWDDTIGADGQHLDVMVGPQPETGPVFVLDENDRKTGKFKQHKTFIGFHNEQAAREAYLATQGKNEKQIAGITEMSREEFAGWREDAANLSRPVSAPPQNEVGETPGPEDTTPPGGAPDAATEAALNELLDVDEHAVEHIQAVEKAIAAVGHDPSEVLPVDIIRAAEIMATNPNTDPMVAFIAAAEEDRSGVSVEPQGEKSATRSELADEQEGEPPGAGEGAPGQGAVGGEQGAAAQAEELRGPQEGQPYRGGEDGERAKLERPAYEAAETERGRETPDTIAPPKPGAESGRAEEVTGAAEPERAGVPDGGEREAAVSPAGNEGERAGPGARGSAAEGEAAGPAEVRKPGLEQRGRWTVLGKNTQGNDVLEDNKGVRAVVENGVRSTEPVAIRPTRGGVTTSVNVENREDRYKTAEEISADIDRAMDEEIAAVRAKEAAAAKPEKEPPLRKKVDEQGKVYFQREAIPEMQPETPQEAAADAFAKRMEAAAKYPGPLEDLVKKPTTIDVRPTKEIAKAAGKAAVATVDESLSAIYDLLGGGKTVSLGFVFDPKTYEAMKPHLFNVAMHFKEFSSNVAELGRRMVRKFAEKYPADAIEKFRGYIKRFVEDVSTGVIDLAKEITNAERGPASDQGQEALGGVAAEEGGGAESGGQLPGSAAGSSETGAGPNQAPDEAGVPGTRGGGSSPAPVHPAEAGAGSRTSALGKNGVGKPGKRVTKKAAETNVEPQAVPNVPAINFRITDEVELGTGGEAIKFADNIKAITVLKAIEAQQRRATPDEQKVLARYVGWGGLANATDIAKAPESWKERAQKLKDLLTPEELRQAARSTSNAHYTSKAVVDAMWKAMKHMGFDGGLVLEPSMGSGNFLGLIPEDLAGKTKFIGVEYDSLTARIAKLLYPQEAVLHAGIQQVPLAEGEFTAIIGNPPFRDSGVTFRHSPELNRFSIHNQVFIAGLDALQSGGIQAMVVSRFLMDQQDESARLEMAARATLLGAIRLPQNAFQENARTTVVTDIIFLRKNSDSARREMEEAIAAYKRRPDKIKAAEETRKELASKVPNWVKTTKVDDPLGKEPITINDYFAGRPRMIMGRLERSGTQFRRDDVTVQPHEGKIEDHLDKAIERLPKNAARTAVDAAKIGQERHESMARSLQLALSGKEPGHVWWDAEKKALYQVTERETPTGDFEINERVVTPKTPWSKSIFEDAEGKFYKLEAKTTETGAKAKEGKRNVYERQYVDKPHGRSLLGDKRYARLIELSHLRDVLKRQIVLETENAPAEEMADNRKALNEAYDAYVKKHGLVNEDRTEDLLRDMPDGALVSALESGYREKAADRPASARKSAILSERVIVPFEPITHADNITDGLIVSLTDTGRIDVPRIAKLMGVEEPEVIKQLTEGEKPLAYYNPVEQRYETRDLYLSGQVSKKLQEAIAANLFKNIDDLKAVQPEPIGASDITVHPGANWIRVEHYQNFITQALGAESAVVEFAPITNTFEVRNVKFPDRVSQEKYAVIIEGNTVASTTWLLQRLFNAQSVKIVEEIEDPITGSKSKRVNKDFSELSANKRNEIEQKWDEWIFKDPARRAELAALYNEKFNTRITRQNDGSHLTLPGKVPDAVIKMRRHQKNATWRGILDRFILFDHVVGAGKTFTVIARVMERRRMGLTKKPMIVVPNHLVAQWTSDFYRLYPGAKVLAMPANQFERSNRRKLFAKAATGDWDAVIVPHSSFKFISLAPETEIRFLEEQIRVAEEAIEEAKETARATGEGGRFKPLTVKQAEKLAETLQARLDKLSTGNRDRLVTFEQMGVDDLNVDEAHEFKNLFYSSKMDSAVRGMGEKSGSEKALDLYQKIKYLQEHPTGSVAFATGTPISNSAAEMYTMMRYLAAKELRDLGLEHFDAWRAQFVSATEAYEATESGVGIKSVTRLGREWSNMRALMELYYSFTDSVTQEDINKAYAEDNNGAKFPIPAVVGGGRQAVAVKPTVEQTRILEEVVAGFNSLPGITNVQVRNAERLRLMDRARKVALDARLADPNVKGNEEGGKLDVMAEHAVRIYKKWTPDKGAIAIFLDRGVKATKQDATMVKAYDDLRAKMEQAAAEGNDEKYRSLADDLDKFDADEIAELRNALKGGFNAYDEMKRNLIARGIPENEIRFAQEAENDAQKKALFDSVNAGEVRIILGSTPRMGAGTNIQQRLVGELHGDPTWKPSDIEQREGRIIRQGNELLKKYPDFAVEILAFVTERTIDAKMWELNSTKLRMINGIRDYNGEHRMEFEDEEAVGMAEIAALASGDPLLMERVKLAADIERLERQKSAADRQRHSNEDRIIEFERVLRDYPAMIAKEQSRSATLMAAFKAAAEDVASRKVIVEGQEFSSETEAMKAAAAASEAQKAMNEGGKYALQVNGVRVTNKDDIEKQVRVALGSNMPPLVLPDGKKLILRKDIADEVNKVGIELEKRGESANSPTFEVGDMLGGRLHMTFVNSRVGGSRTYSMWVEQGGVDLAQVEYTLGKDDKFSIATARTMVERLEKDANYNAQSAGIGMQKRMAEASEMLPGLKEDVQKPFAKEEELQRKQDRKNDVDRTLAATAKEAESNKGGRAQPTTANMMAFARENMTPMWLAKEPEIMAGAARIIERMIGVGRVPITVVERGKVSPATSGLQYGDGELRASYTSENARLVTGSIELAFHSDTSASAYHEGYHAFEDLAATDQQLAALKQDASRWLGTVEKMGYENVEKIPELEIRALAYQRYATMRDAANGADVSMRAAFGGPVHTAAMRFFDKIYRIVRRVRNFMKGLGFQTSEDIWKKLYEGKLADQERRAIPGIRAEILASGGHTAELRVPKAVQQKYAEIFQPEFVSDRAFQALTKFVKFKAAGAQERDAIIKQDEARWHYWNKKPAAERLEFIKKMEEGLPQATPEEQAMADDWRKLLDDNWMHERAWGSMAAYVEDYMPHIWKRETGKPTWAGFIQAKTAQLGPTWFQKTRTLPLIEDGLNKGLELKFTNPSELVTHRLKAGADMRLKMELLHDLKGQGLAWEGVQGGAHLRRRGWEAINAPDRKQWVIHPDAQPLWKNAVADKGLWTADGLAGGAFRGWMQLKNVWVPIKLMLSAFHPLHVLHINQSNHIARGLSELYRGDVVRATKDIMAGIATVPTLGLLDSQTTGKMAQDLWHKRYQDMTADEKTAYGYMVEGGFVPELSEEMRVKASRGYNTALQEMLRGEQLHSSIPRVMWNGIRRVFEGLQGPIFSKWIPRLKAAAYLAEVSRVLRKDPSLNTDAVRRGAALHAVAKSIDNRFGEMFYGNLNWNPVLKQSAIASFLSLGWNLGFVREFGGAAAEFAITRPGRAIGLLDGASPTRKAALRATNKITFALTYVATAAMINAMMTMAFTGDAPNDWRDFVFARIGGTNPDGSPRRVTNMFYLREVPMLLKHIQEAGGGLMGSIAGSWEMVWNKMMYEPFIEVYKNRDYWGSPFRDENAPAWKQVWQVMGKFLGDQGPITFSGANRAAELSGKPMNGLADLPGAIANTKGVALSFLGFGPAPGYVEKSAIQNRIGHLYGEHVAPKSKAYDEDEGHSTNAKFRARTALLVAKNNKDQEAIAKAREEGKKAGLTDKYMNEIGKTPTDVFLFSRLPSKDQRDLLHDASPEERNRYLSHAHKDVKSDPAWYQTQTSP